MKSVFSIKLCSHKTPASNVGKILFRLFRYHNFTLNLYILNKSQVDANMKNWQIYGNLNFCDYIYISVVWGDL